MLNVTINRTTRRKSIVAARKNKKLISLGTFKKLHGGSFSMRKTSEGVYFVGFSSILTNKRAHAWGDNFHTAYRNFLRNFNIKYAA